MPQKTGLLFMVFSGQMGKNELGNQKPFYIKKKTCLSSKNTASKKLLLSCIYIELMFPQHLV